MCKKFAIYVEGQTEQVLLNQLIKLWWNCSGIKIDNIKLKNDLKNTVPNYNSGDEIHTHFVTINIEGMGHLASAIAQRAEKQIENGFDIIGLRDLDYENIQYLHDQTELIDKFNSALKLLGCRHPVKIHLYFAIIKIEAWMLAFHEAVAKWAKVSEKEVLDAIKSKNCKIEEIRNPSKILGFGKKTDNQLKSYHEIQSFASQIDREMIDKVYQSGLAPSFNRFWGTLTDQDHT